LLFVVFQSFGLANGGVESASAILDGLSDHRRVVVTQAETRFCERWRRAGCDVVVWPFDYRSPATRADLLRSRIERASSLMSHNRRIYELITRQQIDILHANDISAFWHSAIGAKAARKPVVFSVRSVFPRDLPYGLKWTAIHHFADEIVCLSEEIRQAATNRFGPATTHLRAARTSVIHTGLDLNRFRPPTPEERAAARKALGIPPQAFAVGSVAKVWKVKNQLPLLQRTAPALLRAVPEAQLWFVGDYDASADPYARKCLAAAEALAPTTIHWAGFVPDPVQHYWALDATVLVSEYEGLARCMVESLACGVPMVSFDVTSAREVLESTGSGLVVPAGDFEGVAKALGRLAASPEARVRARQAGRAVAERLFDGEACRSAYRKLYARLSMGEA
jgi:glycosyltransferase involved in cell wall biosynthesis